MVEGSLGNWRLARQSTAGSATIRSQRLGQICVTGALLGPVLIFLATCFIAPLGELLSLSFSSSAGPLASYREIAASGVYRQVFTNTLILAFNVALIACLLAYPTAYMLSRLRGFALSVALWCVLFPLWISVLVRTFAWILLLGENGPVNRILMSGDLISRPISFLFNSTGVYIGMVHVLLPYALLPIYTAMRNVDQPLLLASDGLGASPFQTFARIYLPLTMPGVAAGFLLVFLLALGFYITPAMLGGMKNMTVAMLIDLFVTEQLVWPLAAAGAFWLLLLVLLLLLVASRFVNLTATVAAR
ncbi:MAG: ABC transporter permease [Pseudolabrys sp.]|nr:ABC transporter permease [Pseudolabrys sp.]